MTDSRYSDTVPVRYGRVFPIKFPKSEQTQRNKNASPADSNSRVCCFAAYFRGHCFRLISSNLTVHLQLFKSVLLSTPCQNAQTCLTAAVPRRSRRLINIHEGVTRLRATLARSALTRVSLARFTLATSILTRFQFGAFLFGALPLRRVSLWRASTSARFSLARFPILYDPTMIRYLRTPVSRGLFPFCEEMLSTLVWRISLFA